VKWKTVGKEKQNSVGRKRDLTAKIEPSGREPVGAGSISEMVGTVDEQSSQMQREGPQKRNCPARLSHS
jgi:hypothetical protein